MPQRLQMFLGEAPAYVRDDRGVVHGLRPDSWVSLDSTSVDPPAAIPRKKEFRAYERLRRRANSRVYHIVLGSALLSLAVAGAFACSLGLANGMPGLGLSQGVFAALAAWTAVRNPAWMRRRALCMHHELFGSSDRCLVCGYDISTCKPDPDGCTTCPECGAAWRLNAASPSNGRQSDE